MGGLGSREHESQYRPSMAYTFEVKTSPPLSLNDLELILKNLTFLFGNCEVLINAYQKSDCFAKMKLNKNQKRKGFLHLSSMLAPTWPMGGLHQTRSSGVAWIFGDF